MGKHGKIMGTHGKLMISEELMRKIGGFCIGGIYIYKMADQEKSVKIIMDNTHNPEDMGFDQANLGSSVIILLKP